MLHTLITTAAGCVLFSSTVQASPFQIFGKRAATALAGYTNQGCYTEATNGRALTGNAFYSDSMTVEKCAAACSSFTWFGVEYGRECYCGDSLNPGSVSTADSDCSFTCPGDSTESCGAGNRLNMYQKASDKTKTGGSDKTTSASSTSSTEAQAAPGKYTAEGCYTEATNGRALASKSYYDDAMTVEKCAAACGAYTYFGLEYYRECYCGNNFQAGSNPAPASDCNHPCVGDSSEVCGGDNRLNAYAFDEKTSSPEPAKTTVGDYAFDGCYTEATNSRALTGGVYYDDAMTVEKCASVCSGFTLFGVEYGRECYCGNSLQSGSVVTSASECSNPCPGNGAESCGGGNRLDVYRMGGKTTSSSSSTTPTSSSMSSTSTLEEKTESSSSSMTPTSSSNMTSTSSMGERTTSSSSSTTPTSSSMSSTSTVASSATITGSSSTISSSTNTSFAGQTTTTDSGNNGNGNGKGNGNGNGNGNKDSSTLSSSTSSSMILNTTLPSTTLPSTTSSSMILNTTLIKTMQSSTTLPSITSSSSMFLNTTLASITLPSITSSSSTFLNTTLASITLPSITSSSSSSTSSASQTTSTSKGKDNGKGNNDGITSSSSTISSSTLLNTTLSSTTLPSTTLPSTTLISSSNTSSAPESTSTETGKGNGKNSTTSSKTTTSSSSSTSSAPRTTSTD